MNVLILTPDAVGSTLLQRMLTIYMQFHEFDRPVINLHELTNGLEKYYSPEFNREIVSKRAVKNWGYYQSLQQVVELLDSVDHYKTSRLAHYHIENRGDTISQQIPFYNYLNENFYIIACRRNNVFEHAVSMALNTITKKLNVYSANEKINTFFDMYQSGIEIDTNVFLNKLYGYKNYIKWSEQYFKISRYFNYEQDVPNIEKFILNLPVFASQSNLVTWNKNFGIDFNDYNRTHFALSDIGSLNFSNQDPNEHDLVEYQKDALPEWPAVSTVSDLTSLPAEIKKEFQLSRYKNSEWKVSFLDQEKQAHVNACFNQYQTAQQTIDQMVSLGIIISGPPIKKQTLADKKKIIKNFDQCVEIYNQWAVKNSDVAKEMSSDDVNNQNTHENSFWNQFNLTIDYKSDPLTIEQSKGQNDDSL
jgi:hypothetical protein